MLRTIRFYHNSPRIDFETEINDIPDYTVVIAEFPLAGDVVEVRRGIPYGFSHSGWSKPNPDLHGWNKGIVPAVRWMDFELAGGEGFAILDRGLTGREIDGSTPIIYLFNSEDKISWILQPLGNRKRETCSAIFHHSASGSVAAGTDSADGLGIQPATGRHSFSRCFGFKVIP